MGLAEVFSAFARPGSGVAGSIHGARLPGAHQAPGEFVLLEMGWAILCDTRLADLRQVRPGVSNYFRRFRAEKISGTVESIDCTGFPCFGKFLSKYQ